MFGAASNDKVSDWVYLCNWFFGLSLPFAADIPLIEADTVSSQSTSDTLDQEEKSADRKLEAAFRCVWWGHDITDTASVAT